MKTFEQFESSFSKATCKLCNNEARAFNDGFCYQHTPSQPTTQHDAQCKGCGGVNCNNHFIDITKENECICKNLVMPSCPIHGVKLKTNLHTSDEWKEDLYFEVTEDLIYLCKMFYLAKDKKQQTENIRNQQRKLEDFISSLLSTAIKTREEEIIEIIEEARNLPPSTRNNVLDYIINKLIK